MFGSVLDVEQVFGHHSDMDRTDVRLTGRSRRGIYRRRRVGAALVTAGILIGGLSVLAEAGAPARDPIRRMAFHRYVVRPGDTIWSIAQHASEPGADPRVLAQRIVDANRVDAGALLPGQALRIPEA